MKNLVRKMAVAARKQFDRLIKPACAVVAGMVVVGTASAQTDFNSSVTTVSGYWTTIQGTAIIIMIFVLGRRMLRKIV